MAEITHTRQGVSPTRIRLTPGLTDPDFMTVGLAARKSEREHLLVMLSAFLESQRARAVPADKILAALNDWIALRLSTLDMTGESTRNHLMIDIETLGVRASAPLAAIGTVFFEPSTGQLGKAFYARVDPRSDEAAGARAEVDTALWWLRQDADARAELIIEPRSSASEALNAFLNYINASQIPAGRKHLNIWCKGGEFDVGILGAAFEHHGLPIPWYYSRVRDMRTLQCLARATGYCSPARQTLKHHALEDACYQAQVVAEIWQRHTDAFLEHC